MPPIKRVLVADSLNDERRRGGHVVDMNDRPDAANGRDADDAFTINGDGFRAGRFEFVDNLRDVHVMHDAGKAEGIVESIAARTVYERHLNPRPG